MKKSQINPAKQVEYTAIYKNILTKETWHTVHTSTYNELAFAKRLKDDETLINQRIQILHIIEN